MPAPTTTLSKHQVTTARQQHHVRVLAPTCDHPRSCALTAYCAAAASCACTAATIAACGTHAGMRQDGTAHKVCAVQNVTDDDGRHLLDEAWQDVLLHACMCSCLKACTKVARSYMRYTDDVPNGNTSIHCQKCCSIAAKPRHTPTSYPLKPKPKSKPHQHASSHATAAAADS